MHELTLSELTRKLELYFALYYILQYIIMHFVFLKKLHQFQVDKS